MIADRSYHRLLQLDWIRADVDGDGRREYVPHDDQTGPRAPEHSYEVFTVKGRIRLLGTDAVAAQRPSRPLPPSPSRATGILTTEPGRTRRFYFGGNIYEGWSSRARPVQGPGLHRTRPETTHDQNLHLQILGGSESDCGSCHVIPQGICPGRRHEATADGSIRFKRQ